MENILTCTKRYRGERALPLDCNGRSRPRTIQAADGFAWTITPRLPKEMKSHRKGTSPQVVPWKAATPDAEAKRIVTTIEQLHERGYRYREIAALFRSERTSAPTLVDALRERGIPFRCAGRTGLFLQSEIQVLARTYAWLYGREWQREMRGESEEVDLDDLVTEYKQVFPGASRFRTLRAYFEGGKAVIEAADRPANLVGDSYRLFSRLGMVELNPDDVND